MAVAVSTFLHLNIVLALAAIYRVLDAPGSFTPIDSRFSRTEPVSLETLETDDIAEVEPAAAMPTLASAVGMLSSEPPDDRMSEFAHAAALIAEGDGGGVGDDADAAASGNGRVGKGKVDFFGAEGHGVRFVFVLDCSKSMRGDRFARARHELSRSLQNLGEEEEFFIYFFSDQAIPMFEPRPATAPVKATKLMLGKARRWIVNRGAFGNTMPNEALRLALQMKPDVIFFLTDGEFHPGAIDVCRAENHHGTAIHTIAFGTRLGEQKLKQIAAENQGRYRFVP